MLSGRRGVSAKTRAAIEQAMAELNYSVDSSAQSLASGSPKVLALHLPSIGNGTGDTIFSIITGAYTEAAAQGYLLSVWPTPPAHAPNELVKLVKTKQAAGLILLEIELDDPRIMRLEREKIPFVAVGRPRNTADVNCVDIDFESATRDAVKLLASHNRSKLILLGHDADAGAAGTYAAAHRTSDAFDMACKEFDLSGRIYFPDYTPLAGRELARALIGDSLSIDAVVSMNEFATIGFVHELTNLGYSVPSDVSVINIATSERSSEMTTPNITSLVADGDAIGREAVRALLETLRGHAVTEDLHHLVKCRLSPGASLG